MSENKGHERGSFFLILIAFVLLSISSGCLGFFEDRPGADAELTSFVPEGADAVLRANVTALTTSPTTEKMVDSLLAEGYGGYDAVFAEAEKETGLDPGGLEEVAAFGRFPEASPAEADPYVAAVYRTRWGPEDMREAVEGEARLRLTESSYNGAPFYTVRPDGVDRTFHATKLAEGVYVVGTERAVRDASDVSWKGADALGGELRGALGGDREVRLAVSASEETVKGARDLTNASQGLPPEVLQAVSVVSGSYRTDDDNGTVGVSVGLLPSERGETESLRETVDGLLDFGRVATEDDEISEAIKQVSVSAEGSEVVATYRADAETVAERLRSVDERALLRRFGAEEMVGSLDGIGR